MSLNEKLEFLKSHKEKYTIYIDRDEVFALPEEGSDLESVYLGNTADDILAELFESMGLNVGEV